MLLNVALPRGAHATLTTAARRESLPFERFIEHAVRRALADHAEQEIDHLGRTVHQLLAHASPARLLIAVGHALTQLSKESLP
ncbi:hypothetical protein [Streptomyces sp. NPDC052107]|uniref:hypothetical protein n=1 Tax=Streptomyces sp. NPDC052107 TaxID=3155632 RepID=UPI003436A8C1